MLRDFAVPGVCRLRRALAFVRVSGPDAATFCALAEHEIETPRSAWEYLAGEAEFRDGDIAYPDEAMPYAVLWVLTATDASFRPPYGQVIDLTP
jgi:hypothetical protein